MYTYTILRHRANKNVFFFCFFEINLTYYAQTVWLLKDIGIAIQPMDDKKTIQVTKFRYGIMKLISKYNKENVLDNIISSL